MAQRFKGDDTELKFEASAEPLLSAIGTELNAMDAGAFNAMPLGDALHNLKASPLARAIKQSIFRTCFNDIFSAFVYAGSFEGYITVFKKIFGETAVIEFTVPAPGKLLINIEATLEEFNFVARRIVSGAYVFDNVIYEDGDGTGNILFRNFKGFESQYELEKMLFELVPGGVYTEITLTTGV